PFRASSPERIAAFRAILEAAGIPTTVRRTLGQQIEAACGQLRRQAIREKAAAAATADRPEP
ncbi:MAG TPA: hypothetical protein VIL95_04700, partial [Bacillota bacterium]